MEPYKLKSEIKEFILSKAREHPELGCRKLANVIQENFQANISKSTINSVLKSAGLNKAVGRRRIHPKALLPVPASASQNSEVISQPKGVSNTSALSESSLRGSPPQADEEAVQTQESLRGAIATKQSLRLLCFARNDDKAPPIVEPLLAEPQETQECGEWFLKATELCLGGIPGVEDTYNSENINAVTPQIFSELVSNSTEVLAIKFILEDNSAFFVDPAGHTIWSTARIPERLGVGLHKTRTYLNERILSGRQPLILQAAPGFDTPIPAFLDFIDSFESEKPNKAIKSIELYSADNLLIDTIKLTTAPEKRYFIMGLWPWQYKNRDFSLPLRLLSINGPDNQKRLDIITNLRLDKQSDAGVIGHYLTYWLNLESGYQDFLEEIGHFIRSAKTKVRNNCPIILGNGEELTYEQLLNFWKLILNSYCQKHFFPPSYQGLDFLVLQERFYHLGGTINSTVSTYAVKFVPPENFLYLKDLQYACHRISEANINLSNGLRLVLEVG